MKRLLFKNNLLHVDSVNFNRCRSRGKQALSLKYHIAEIMIILYHIEEMLVQLLDLTLAMLGLSNGGFPKGPSTEGLLIF